MSDKANVARSESQSITFYPDGFLMVGAKRGGRPENFEGKRRGKVGGFSRAARARFRELLLTSTGPAGWQEFFVTLTVPGPVLTEAEWRKLWINFKERVRRMGWLCIWRREVQQRGAMHWHCFVWIPPERGRFSIALAWWGAVRSLGPVERYVTRRGRVVSASSRMGLPGAEKRAVWIEGAEAVGRERQRVKRYAVDHGSKLKRVQEAASGRHWGVIRRDLLVRLDGERESVSIGEMLLFERAMRRLATPGILCAKAPFGRRLGRPCLRGKSARSVWYTLPDTGRRVLAWARVEAAARGPEWQPLPGRPAWVPKRVRTGKRAAMHPDVRRGLWFVELSEKSGAGRMEQGKLL